MQVVNLKEINTALVDKSTVLKQQEQQVVQSALSGMEIQRDSFAAEIQRLRKQCDERVLQNEQLLQNSCQFEHKKEQDRKVLIEQANQAIQQKEEQAKIALKLKDEQTRYALAQKDALISSALVNNNSALAKTAEGMQSAEMLAQQQSQEIQQYQHDLQAHALTCNRKTS